MAEACYTYAARAFRIPSQIRAIIDSGTVFDGGHSISPWFTQDSTNTGARAAAQGARTPYAASGVSRRAWPGATMGLHLGDLIVFKPPQHIAVATGAADQVVQSGYPVQTTKEAERLHDLLVKRRTGQLTKAVPRLGGGFKENPEKLEYDKWLLRMGPSTVSLHHLGIIYSASNAVVHVYHLKDEFRDLLDPSGPLGRFIRRKP